MEYISYVNVKIINFCILYTLAAAPPVNVEATQASASAPVEVSWSPPSDGPTTITGYRIFYGNGENQLVFPPITGIILSLNEDSVGEIVSLRSEADQLSSQLINVTITGQLKHTACMYAVNMFIHTTSLPPHIQPLQKTQQLKMYKLSLLVPVL